MPTCLPILYACTLADAGVDRVVSAQAALTRDTTYLVNGAQVGARDIVTVSFAAHSTVLCSAATLCTDFSQPIPAHPAA